MVYFVGAGPGAADLVTLRGARLIGSADQIIYAGSLVNPALLEGKKEGCRVFDSARMTLEEVLERIREAERAGQMTVRLHTGDPCLYGAIREQMDQLDLEGIAYEVCPGVSSFCGAAASLGLEYTLPGISQSVIITRMAGRTPVPERESIASFAAHGATMVVFLSAGLLRELQQELLRGGYGADTPAAIVYKATWPDEKRIFCRVGALAETAEQEGIKRMALIVVGDVTAARDYERSKLYDPAFTTGFREGKAERGAGAPEGGTETPESGTATPEGGTATPEGGTETPESGTVTSESGTGMPEGGTDAPEGETDASDGDL